MVVFGTVLWVLLKIDRRSGERGARSAEIVGTLPVDGGRGEADSGLTTRGGVHASPTPNPLVSPVLWLVPARPVPLGSFVRRKSCSSRSGSTESRVRACGVGRVVHRPS